MCGIVGYIGKNQAVPFLLDGLEKLEYRGYDSAGIAVCSNGKIAIEKKKGRLKNLREALKASPLPASTVGIGHTRWATHGKPCDVNAHPHVSESGKVAVVHNGIIENYISLKKSLIEKGYSFKSETDTEVIAQLIDSMYNGDILDTVLKVVKMLEGSYSLVITCSDEPDRLVAVKQASPLIIGIGNGENYIASDIPATLSKTRDVIRLEENQIALVTSDEIKVFDEDGNKLENKITHVNWDVDSAEKNGYEHFMIKEIMEQPKALKNTIAPRIDGNRIKLDEINLSEDYLKGLNKICIVACGSAYHVGCVGKYVIEKIAKIPVEVDLASEFRYRSPIIDDKTLVIVVSQSGETADTLSALREAKKLKAKVLSIVNVVGSSIASESDYVLYTCAGPEIAVATTKSYSTQLSVIYLLALYISQVLETISQDERQKYIEALLKLPSQVECILEQSDNIKEIAQKNSNLDNVFFIGRTLDYAVCMEGSLKLKEISYVHSEAYAAGELKHGTISLIENGTLVVSIATQDELFDKMVSNIREVKSRGATILAITTENNKDKINEVSDLSVFIPKTCDIMTPSLSIIPLQLLSYYVALFRGCDIDKPRNLAKSVTVE